MTIRDLGPEDKDRPALSLVESDGFTCVLVTTESGETYATAPVCPHLGAPMVRGELNGTLLTCPLHGWQFDLSKQGHELNGYRPIKVFRCSKAKGRLFAES